MKLPEKVLSQPLLLSVHGIRTTGRWQKQLTEAAQDAGIRYRPLDFGYFFALSLLLPWVRKSKIEWFHNECEEKLRDVEPGQCASIVAHSFGTYLLCGALVKYSDLRFDRIILCGSIVREDFPWSSIIVNRGQVNVVLNEAGGKDMWASIVCWAVSDSGRTGVVGFRDNASGRVIERIHAEHQHSDYFYIGNYRRVWIPFLRGEPIDPVEAIAKPKRNWRFATTLGLIALFGIALIFSRVILRKQGPDFSVPTSGTLEQRNEQAFVSDKPDANKSSAPETVEIGGTGYRPGLCEGSAAMYEAEYRTASTIHRTDPNMKIEVAGHTDGIEEDAEALSACRAQRVYEYLRLRGLSASQMIVHGYGATRPIDSNSTEEGRSRNRRVEVLAGN